MATRAQIERLAQRIEALGRTDDKARPQLGIIRPPGETREEWIARRSRKIAGGTLVGVTNGRDPGTRHLPERCHVVEEESPEKPQWMKPQTLKPPQRPSAT